MKVPLLIVPMIIVSAIASGVVLGQRVPAPTYVQDFATVESAGQVQRVDLIVDNLLCRGRSGLLARFLSQDPGIVRVETYVAQMRARILFDPRRTNLDAIRQRIESKIQVPARPQADHETTAPAVRGAAPQQMQTVQPFRVIEVRD